MKTLRKMKKGFTIVELVIVIAVIAILTAILVPTFISISNKADKASDESLKNYLNKALAIVENDRELNKNGDNKGKTMHFAVEDLDEYGITLDKIVTKSDEKLVWNSTDNRFYFESEAPAVVAERLNYWRIQTNGNDADGYAIYAGKNFAETNGVVNVCVGFDAGYQENVKQINYTNTGSQKTVAIRSNGGSLIVNAPLDTVHHYSDLDSLSVERIAGKSYHEHGNVKASATLNDGHVVVESTGFINELDIPESATSTATVDIKSNAVVNTAVIDSDSATVEIAAGAEVNQLVGETTNVTGEGSAEAKTSAIVKTEVATRQELVNAVSAGDKYISITADMTLPKWDADDNVGVAVLSDLILDGNNHTLTVSAGRGIWIDADNVSLTVKNMKMVGSSSAFQRAIQVNGDCRGAKLSIENFEVTNASYYAINICNNSDVDLMITNSKITGWGAVNLWSADYKVYISNCELTGLNDKGYNAEGWNNFGTVILEGDTTHQTTDHSSTIDVEIINTKISAKTTDQGNKQWCILFNAGCTANNVKLNGCTLDYNESKNTFKFLDQGEGNNLYIDGVKVN